MDGRKSDTSMYQVRRQYRIQMYTHRMERIRMGLCETVICSRCFDVCAGGDMSDFAWYVVAGLAWSVLVLGILWYLCKREDDDE